MEKLVERFQPLVRAIVRSHARPGEPIDDLTQVALLGLVKAIERYQPQAGSSFSSYARPTIAGELKRYFRDHTWAMKVPRSQKELRARIAHARAASPGASDEAIALELRITVAELREGELIDQAYRTSSLDFPTGSDDPASSGSLADRLGIADRGFADVEADDEISRALSILGPRDREVVRLRFFDEALQREIGERVGVSQMQVSRIVNRALEQMREHLDGAAPTPSDPDDERPLRHA